MIKQEITIKASCAEVYQLLTRSELFCTMTGGAPANIGIAAGDEFYCFGKMIHGRNIELIENEMIVQAWRAKPWPKGHYSIVTFTLQAQAAQTKLTLLHTGFADEQKAHLAQGWHDNYWTPMQQYFNS